MSALTKIRKAGFNVTLIDEFIGIEPKDKLTGEQRNYLKKHKIAIIEELKIAAWLSKIEERDQEIIEGVLTQSTNDPEARNYFLKRADGIVRPH